MASYTMQLREYIEQTTQDNDSMTIRDRIEAGRSKLFDFDYPLFDVNYKKVFETHFIRKFYMREIGFETEGLFKFQLETWLLINMPYFNKLFESELITYDPLVNSHMETTHTTTKGKDQTQTNNTKASSSGTSSENVTSDTTDSRFNRHLDSQTPDERLTITSNNGEGVIEYASAITEESDNGSTTTSGNTTGNTTGDSNIDGTLNATINETEDYVQSRTGKVGVATYSKMMNEYRNSLLRVENKIFDEMQELFMLVY
ncbi:MAG: lower collar protein [Ignavibacteria bacterium]|jgi:hypothetical protein|nr:lower collar protein [Ignavibacteria bacterium]